MACGCRKRPVGPSAKLSSVSPELFYDDQNFLILAANPDDPEVYLGYARTSAVFIAGYGTEHERLFHQGNASAAKAWAAEHRVTLRKASASNVCKQVMEAVLAGTYPSVAA